VALNLRFNTRNKQETLEEISDKVFPHFHVNIAPNKKQYEKDNSNYRKHRWDRKINR